MITTFTDLRRDRGQIAMFREQEMRIKTTMFNIAHVIGRGLGRWLELLGQNPSLARDHGLCAWQYLNDLPSARRPTPAPGVPLTTACHIDDPHMPVGLRG